MSLTKQEFDYIRNWAKERSAISLEEDKEYLVTSRLMPVAKRYGMRSMADLVRELSGAQAPRELADAVVDAMTTNETFFFRDTHPFVMLREKLLPAMEASNRAARQLNIWSAACSTGQEVYSLAMIIREHFPQFLGWDLKLYATDLSPTVIEKAKRGIYSDMEVRRGLSDTMRERYFRQAGVGYWQISESLRSMVDFSVLNFLDSWPDAGRHDIVLIRNVLIYFELEDKRRILERVRSRLSPSGAIMLGTSETTLNVDPNWEQVKDGMRSVYYVPRGNN